MIKKIITLKPPFMVVLIVVLMVLHSNYIIAQSSESIELPKIIPPSPEASSLFKFEEVPISLYTGTPNISIPIYTIQTKEISLPISLSYHARGIKVSEVASRVGIGWSLNYGGLISRQVRGKADDDGAYGYLNSDYLSDFFENVNTRSQVYTDYVQYGLDLNPDQFFYSILADSGKFIFDQNTQQAVIQKFSDKQISYVVESGKLSSFIITDGSGISYYFGKSKDGTRIARDYDQRDGIIYNEQTANITFLSDEGDFIHYNSWHLMDIETPNGQLIEFHYELEEPIYYERSFDKIQSNGYVKSYFHKVYSSQYQVKRIVFPNGRLEFVPSTIEREDLASAFNLDKVRLYDYSSELIKEFKFNYNYTTSSNDNNQLGYLKQADPKANKRLFLESIKVNNPKSTNSINILPYYEFDYNTVKLPNRFSNSQDIWGYYNGADNGRFLTFFDYGNQSVNRRVDTIKSGAGLLKSIKYPTGGKAVFQFEQNLVKNNPALNNTSYQDPNPIESIQDGLSNLEQGYYNDGMYGKSISIGDSMIGSLHSEAWITGGDECAASPDCGFLIWLDGGSQTYSIPIGEYELSGVPPGDYTLFVQPKYRNYDPYDMTQGFNIILSWEESIESIEESDVIYAAGKRIKEIDYVDSDDRVVSFKEYRYLNDNGETSGKLFGLPNYYSINRELTNGDITVLKPYGAVPGSPLSSFQGNTLGYGKVTEIYGNTKANQGKKEYAYTMWEDTGRYYEFPYHIPTDNEWLRGKPLNTKIYKRNIDNTYTIVKEVSQNYLYSNSSSSAILSPIPVEKSINEDMNISMAKYKKDRELFRMPLFIFTSGNSQETGEIFYKTFHLTGGTFDLSSIEEKNYLDNGNVLTVRTDYNYDYNDHYMISEIKTKNSKGQSKLTQMLYSSEYNELSGLTNSAENAAIGLVSENRINEVLEEKTFLDENSDGIFQTNERISTKRNIYQKYTDLVLPYEIQTSKGEESLKTEIKFLLYDTVGNPLEVSKETGAITSYLWGYNNQLPVAKIENATYAEIESLVYFGANFNLGHSSLTNNQESSIRNNLPNSIITTYKYDPLIGITSKSDHIGNDIYYIYDEFIRLKEVRDNNNYLLKDLRYNYKGQN